MRKFADRVVHSIRRRRSFLLFGTTSVIGSTANLAAGVMVLRWVPPELMGFWQAALFAMALCDLSKLGVLNGMNREYPYRLGRGEVDSARQAVAAASAFMLVSTVIGALVFTALVVYNWDAGVPIRLALIAGGLTWCAAYYGGFVQATCRGSNDFEKLSTVQLFDACLAVASLVLVWQWGFVGLCIRAVLLASLSAILLHVIRPVRVRPRLDVSQLRELLVTGLPLFGASYLFMLGQNAERAALLATQDMEVVGLLAPLLAVQTAMLMLPNAALIYAYPKLSFSHGRDEARTELWRKALRFTMAGVLVSAALALVALLTAPWLVLHVFPAYGESLPGIRWVLLGGVILAARPIVSILPVLRSWRWHYAWTAVFVASKWGFCSYFVTRMDPIEGVALGGVAAAAASAGIMFIGAYRATHGPLGT